VKRRRRREEGAYEATGEVDAECATVLAEVYLVEEGEGV
jgi:hypothetical protein